MEIIIRSETGEFTLGGRNPTAKILKVVGLGLPQKEQQTAQFAQEAGQKTTSVRDLSRTITIGADFFFSDMERIYKILYYECDIIFKYGRIMKKIKGRCINPEEFEHKCKNINVLALQFECDSPYFSDANENNIPIYQRIDNLPNSGNEIQLPCTPTARINSADLNITSDIPIYPIIEIKIKKVSPTEGADKLITFHNATTEKDVKIENYTTANDEIITIDLERRKITSSINGNITTYISSDTEMADCFLIRGHNIVSCIDNNSADEILSSIIYSNSYLSAVYDYGH